MVEVEQDVGKGGRMLVLEGVNGTEIELVLTEDITTDQMGLLADSLRSHVRAVLDRPPEDPSRTSEHR